MRGQLSAALDALEVEINGGRGWLFEDRLTLADITLATAFAFTQAYLADIVDKTRYPSIVASCARAEELPEFRAAPAEDGVTVSPLAR